MLHWSLKIVTPPAIEPVDLVSAKQHLRVDNDDDNGLISDLITAAREHVENVTGRALINATYRMTLDRFPLWPGLEYSTGEPAVPLPAVHNGWPLDPTLWSIQLPRAPLGSVTLVQYVDPNGQTQTLATNQYVVDGDSEPPRLTPINGGAWPSVQFGPKAVTITFVAGYGVLASDVPGTLKHAIRLLVGHWYENREAVLVGTTAMQLPSAVEALLGMQRVPWA